MALSEASYSLALDYPLPQDSAIPEQQGSSESLNENLLDKRDPDSSIILYQRKKSSRNKLDQTDVNTLEVDMYTFEFQWGIFFRSFFICLYYTSGTGMLLSALFPCFHTKFYKNYFIYSNNSLLRITGITSVIQLVSLVLIPQKVIEDVLGKASPVIIWSGLLYALVIFSITSAAREAYCHQKLADILKTRKLGEKSLDSTRFRVDYLWSRDLSSRINSFEAEKKAEGILKGEMKKEKESFVQRIEEDERTCALQTTISRLNTNISLYYISFFEGVPENLLRKLKQKQDLAVIEQGDFLICSEDFPQHDVLKAISQFEQEIFKYKYFTKSSKYDEKKAFGYSLALDLLLNTKQKISVAAVLIWVIPAALFIFQYLRVGLNFFTKAEVQDWPVLEKTLSLVFMIPMALYFSWIPYVYMISVISQGIKILTAKYLHMGELKELMSTNTERLDKNGEKSYPTLNILDFKSLESWMKLRKIFMHLYDEKLQGIILAMSLSLIIQFTGLMVPIFAKITFDGSLNSKDFIQIGFHVIFHLTIFLLFAFYAAKVNAQFKVHRNIILSNKQIVESLFKYYSDFIGEKASEPGSYIENEGVKFLKKQYGDHLSVEIEKEMEKDRLKLVATYESVLAELEREEYEHPIKILGLPITKTVVKSAGTLLASLLFSVLKAQLSSLFHK